MAYILALAATLAYLLWVRYPYHWFLLALTLWTAQSVNVAFPGSTEQWTATWWMYPEIAVPLAVCVAVTESCARGIAEVPNGFRRLQAGVACIGIPISLAGLGAYLIVRPTGNFLDRFLVLRGWAWVGLALAMLTAELLLIGIRRPRLVAWHHRLLLCLLLAHAITAPFVPSPQWWNVRGAYRWAVMGCCAGWIIAARGCGKGSPARRATAS